MNKVFALVALLLTAIVAFGIGRRTAPPEVQTKYIERPGLPDRVVAIGPPAPIFIERYTERLRVDTVEVEKGVADSVCTTVPSLWKEDFRIVPSLPLTELSSSGLSLLTYDPFSRQYERLSYQVPQRKWRAGLYILGGVSGTPDYKLPFTGVSVAVSRERLGASATIGVLGDGSVNGALIMHYKLW